jgi:hypothetical protein
MQFGGPYELHVERRLLDGVHVRERSMWRVRRHTPALLRAAPVRRRPRLLGQRAVLRRHARVV